MSVLINDLIYYASANMPEDDSSTSGGGIDTAVRIIWSDLSADDTLQIVAAASADTGQGVTVTGRDAAGSIVSETLNTDGVDGQTPAAGSQTFDRTLKHVKGGTFTDDVAIERGTATTTGTAQTGAAETASAGPTITLAAGAVSSDGDFVGEVIRLTGGTGAGQIRRILDSTASSDKVVVDRDWGTVPDNTTTYRISEGVVLEKSLGGAEVNEVRRPFYDAQANASGGSQKQLHEKIFAKNIHGSLSLTSATVKENADPSGDIDFTVEDAVDDTNSVANRTSAPTGNNEAFSDTDKSIPGSDLAAGSAIGIWLRLTLPAGEPATSTTYTPEISGNTT